MSLPSTLCYLQPFEADQRLLVRRADFIVAQGRKPNWFSQSLNDGMERVEV